MSGAQQAVFQNQRSFGLKIGAAFGGGFFAGQISTTANGIATHNLVVCDKSVGEALKNFGPYGTTTGIVSVIDGPANSAALAALGASYQGATFCEAINTGGFTDWYMPAKNELEVLYYYFKPSTTSNVIVSGSNANSVSPEPLSTNYTTGSPAQTSVTSFRTGASSQEFDSANYYFSSTEANFGTAWDQFFGDGTQDFRLKSNTNFAVRAVRRVAV